MYKSALVHFGIDKEIKIAQSGQESPKELENFITIYPKLHKSLYNLLKKKEEKAQNCWEKTLKNIIQRELIF